MYKVQSKTQSNVLTTLQKVGIVMMIVGAFSACFFATQGILTAVYGQTLEANGSAYIGAGAAALVNPVDNYVSSIKESICPTLHHNITAEAECMQI